MIKLVNSSIVIRQSSGNCIGTAILDLDAIHTAVIEAIETTEAPEDGQMFLQMPCVAEAVSCGVAMRTMDSGDFFSRNSLKPGTDEDGPVTQYMKREKAPTCDFVACIVHTIDAYLKDPDVANPEQPEEANRVKAEEATHVLVIVLGSAGPESPLTPGTFVRNMAGHNNNMAFITQPGGGVGEGAVRCKVDRAWIEQVTKLQSAAAEINTYWSEWSVVADQPAEHEAMCSDDPAAV